MKTFREKGHIVLAAISLLLVTISICVTTNRPTTPYDQLKWFEQIGMILVASWLITSCLAKVFMLLVVAIHRSDHFYFEQISQIMSGAAITFFFVFVVAGTSAPHPSPTPAPPTPLQITFLASLMLGLPAVDIYNFICPKPAKTIRA